MTAEGRSRTLGSVRDRLRDHGDLALALGLTILMEAELWLSADRTEDRRLLAPVAIGIGACVLARRRAPLAALAAAMALNVLANVLAETEEDPIFLIVTVLVLVYSVGAHAGGRAAPVGAALVAVAIGLALAQDPESPDVGGLVFFTVVIGGPWVAGRAMRARRERERILVAERDERARAAVAEERVRIARERHDVVAHAMGVVVLQARGARRVLGRDPAAASRALDEIEATGGHALQETRRLLGLLRSADDDASLAPAPSLAQVPALAATVRESGLPVVVRIAGERRELPAGVELSAYRIVQESLTNVLRHARATSASVLVRYADDAVELEIVDDGAGAANGDGGGHGLIGMRERVALLGGRLDAGPEPEGGFGVRARIPL